jgi:acyl-CoA dehydrogenase
LTTAEVVPHLEQWRLDGTIPRGVLAAAGAAGFLGTTVAEEFGGGGADDSGFSAVLIEEIAAVGATTLSLLCALHVGVAIPALSTGKCTRWLPRLVSGELIATVTAPTAKSDFALAGGQLSGELASVPYARLADLLLVDLGDDNVAVVEIDQHGVRIGPDTPILGGHEGAAADVILVGANVDVIRTSLTPSIDQWFAVTMLAASRAALQLGVEYVTARKVFGQPLATFENTRFRIAELWAEVSAATLLVDSCIAAGIEVHVCDAAAARLTAARVLDAVVDQCLQFHGGYGYMREYPISTAFADARFLRLAAQRFSDPRHRLARHVGM